MLGGISNPASHRPIADYDVSGYARGAAALAQGTKDIGTGISSAGKDIAAAYKAQQNDTNELELAKAESNWLLKSKQANDELSAEIEPDKLKEKYEPKYKSAFEESAALISDPKRRELWSLKRQPDVLERVNKTTDYAFSLSKDREIAASQDKLVGLREAALMETDPAKREDYIKTAQLRIQGLEDAGYITKQAAGQMKRGWVEDLSTAAVQIMPPEERVKLLRPQTTSDQVVDKIIGNESGGKANAKNPLSSAYGNGQFINSTWLSLIKETKPELAQGRSDADLLELRGDKILGREMVAAYAAKNSTYLKSQGIDANPGNVYLAHFLGPQGAAAVLKADPNTPVSEIVGRDAVRANPSILGGKTAGSVVAWSENKMGGAGSKGGPVDFIPADKRMQMYRVAETEVSQRQNAAGMARGEELERTIIDAKAGKADMPPRAAIEQDPSLAESDRNKLLVRYDSAVGDVASAQAAWTKFSDPKAGSFNPYDKDDRDNADVIYQRLGGGAPALQAVVDRTGIMPASAAKAIRGDIISGSAPKVAAALTLSSNLLTRNPNVFAKTEGKEDIENNAITFRTYVDNFGMSAEAAAQKIIKEQTPEYQAQLKTKLKNEDIGEIVKKKLSITDLTSAFNEGLPIIGRPNVEFDPGSRKAAFDDYAEIFRDRYLETGDVSAAKAQAVSQMKKVWGVSSVSGTSTLMKYPPEKSPVFAGIEGASVGIAKQAIDTIKAETGQDIDRKGLRFAPIPGLTAGAFKSGEPAPYMLMWTDKNGVVQSLNPGKAYVPDVGAIQAAQAEQRRASLEGRQVIADPMLNRREQMQANRQTIKDAARERYTQTKREVGLDVADR